MLVYICLGFIFSYLGVRGIFGGDSSEYSFISQVWGIAHPPGYPLYALLTNCMRILTPFLNEYTRLNLFSIIPGIAASYILYRSIFLLTGHKLISVGTSLFFIFLYPVWLYLEVPEVFMLNLFFLSAISHSIFLINVKKKYTLFPILGALIGLSIAHHHTFLFFVPGWMYLSMGLFQKVKHKFRSFFLYVILGASVYIYVPTASYFNPPLDIENAKTLSGFFSLFFRTSYGTFRAYSGASQNILNQLFNTISTFIFLLHDYKPIGIVLILVGLAYMKLKREYLFKYFLIHIFSYLFFLFLTNFFLNSAFTIATYERFLIAFYYILGVPFAFGLVAIHSFVNSKILPKVEHTALRNVVTALPTLLIIGLVVINCSQSFQYIKELKNLKAFNTYALDLLNTAEKGSIISIQGDTSLFSTAYYYYAKKTRSDLHFINFSLVERPDYYKKIVTQNGGLSYPNADDRTVSEFLSLNSNKVAIYSNQPISIGVWMPYGLLWKFYENESAASKEARLIFSTNERLWSTYTIPVFSPRAKNILYIQNLQDDYISMYFAYGLALAQHEEYGKATHIFKTILSIYNKNHVDSATTLVELGFINKASCVKIKEYANILIRNEDKLHKDDISTLLRYFKNCDPNNPLNNEFTQTYNSLLKSAEVPLNKL